MTGRASPPPFEVIAPTRRSVPFVYASPHSGDHYPRPFVAASSLDPLTLRRSEDAFVDRLFAAAPAHGAPLIRARYARVYLDVNREPYELDPTMYDEPLPAHANTTSLRVAGGLGTIARIVAEGAEVYRGKLALAEIEARLDTIYRPYHQALGALLTETRAAFGHAVLIDCHSMPSIGGPNDSDGGRRRSDIVLGDRFGTTANSELVEWTRQAFREAGFVVARNNPYAGGFTTHHYGRPADGFHTLQVEINRALYMNETAITPNDDFDRVAAGLSQVVARLAEYRLERPLAAE